MTRRAPTRRGIAMLLVLVVLVVAVTAAANVARVSVAGIATESVSDRIRRTDDLLLQAERAAFSWLHRESAGVVLPPDASSPSLGILHDLVETGDRSAEICMTAIDLTGLVPFTEAIPGSDLGSAIPGDVLSAIGSLIDDDVPPGPDQLANAALDRPIFPRPLRSSFVRFGEASGRAASAVARSRGTTATDTPAVTELVAFIRPTPARPHGRANVGTVFLNVNTAPIRLLAPAFALAGIDALDPVIDARARGEQAIVSFDADDGRHIRFLASSPLWAFRADVRIGGVQRSWWSIFELRSGSWRLVQRITIHG